MLVGHVYIMIFIAQSITQQKKIIKKNNSKRCPCSCFRTSWAMFKPIIRVHLQYTLNIAYTHTLYTAYLAHTHIQFQMHLRNFNLGMPHTVLTRDFQLNQSAVSVQLGKKQLDINRSILPRWVGYAQPCTHMLYQPMARKVLHLIEEGFWCQPHRSKTKNERLRKGSKTKREWEQLALFFVGRCLCTMSDISSVRQYQPSCCVRRVWSEKLLQQIPIPAPPFSIQEVLSSEAEYLKLSLSCPCEISIRFGQLLSQTVSLTESTDQCVPNIVAATEHHYQSAALFGNKKQGITKTHVEVKIVHMYSFVSRKNRKDLFCIGQCLLQRMRPSFWGGSGW